MNEQLFHHFRVCYLDCESHIHHIFVPRLAVIHADANAQNSNVPCSAVSTPTYPSSTLYVQQLEL